MKKIKNKKLVVILLLFLLSLIFSIVYFSKNSIEKKEKENILEETKVENKKDTENSKSSRGNIENVERVKETKEESFSEEEKSNNDINVSNNIGNINFENQTKNLDNNKNLYVSKIQNNQIESNNLRYKFIRNKDEVNKKTENDSKIVIDIETIKEKNPVFKNKYISEIAKEIIKKTNRESENKTQKEKYKENQKVTTKLDNSVGNKLISEIAKEIIKKTNRESENKAQKEKYKENQNVPTKPNNSVENKLISETQKEAEKIEDEKGSDKYILILKELNSNGSLVFNSNSKLPEKAYIGIKSTGEYQNKAHKIEWSGKNLNKVKNNISGDYTLIAKTNENLVINNKDYGKVVILVKITIK